MVSKQLDVWYTSDQQERNGRERQDKIKISIALQSFWNGLIGVEESAIHKADRVVRRIAQNESPKPVVESNITFGYTHRARQLFEEVVASTSLFGKIMLKLEIKTFSTSHRLELSYGEWGEVQVGGIPYLVLAYNKNTNHATVCVVDEIVDPRVAIRFKMPEEDS